MEQETLRAARERMRSHENLKRMVREPQPSPAAALAAAAHTAEARRPHRGGGGAAAEPPPPSLGGAARHGGRKSLDRTPRWVLLRSGTTSPSVMNVAS